MKAVCEPGSKLAGKLEIIPSKSSLHRLLLCSALAEGESAVAPYIASKDIEASLNAIRYLGAEARVAGGEILIDSKGLSPLGGEFDVGESGSTLRFVIPLALCSSVKTRILGREGLARRPLGPFRELFDKPGLGFRHPEDACLPLDLQGPLTSGDFRLPGDVSSQFISGLLMALPLLKGDSRVILTTALESAEYAAMTVATLRDFGVEARVEAAGSPGFPFGGWSVNGGQAYRPGRRRAEGDWSGAAFWVAAKALGARIELGGLDRASLQPDRRIEEICRDSPREIDVSACPDLLPVLAAWAGLCGHPVKIRGAARVRYKECDRVAAMAKELNAIGGKLRELPDGLDIEPVGEYSGGETADWNDHRVVMALALASLGSRNAITIGGAGAVAKSYPGFFEDFTALGGRCHVE